MTWSSGRLIELDPSALPSLSWGNLAFDGDGRFAFASGSNVVVTRRSTIFSKLDYLVPGANHEVEVSQCGWWSGVRGFARPLLVVACDATDEDPAKLSVLDVSGSKQKRIFHLDLTPRLWGEEASEPGGGCEEIPVTVQGMTTMMKQDALLWIGLSNGRLLGLTPGLDSRALEVSVAFRCFDHSVTAVASDRTRSPYIAAADESGLLKVWDSLQDWREVYSWEAKEAVITSLAMRGTVLVCGLTTGDLYFHDIESYRVLMKIAMTSRPISAMDTHPSLDLLVVAGEDGRASILTFPKADECVRVILSVSLNGAITGIVFTALQEDDSPSVTLVALERPYLIQYNFDRVGQRMSANLSSLSETTGSGTNTSKLQ